MECVVGDIDSVLMALKSVRSLKRQAEQAAEWLRKEHHPDRDDHMPEPSVRIFVSYSHEDDCG